MKAVIQRVSAAAVHVDGTFVSGVGKGFLVFLGVGHNDSEQDADRLAAKVLKLRIFEDSEGRMNLDLPSAGGAVLCVSQFTLYADLRTGNRPSFDRAAGRNLAEPLYERFCEAIEASGVECKRGIFGAEMAVDLTNDGPVTILLDTEDFDRPRRA